MCIGISILPLQLIGVLFAESQMCIEKVETSQHLKDASYKIIGMQSNWDLEIQLYSNFYSH